MDCSAEHIKIFLGFQNDNVYDDCNFGDGSVIDFILAGKPAPKMELAKINAIVLMTKATLTTLEQFIASNCDYMLELIIWLGYHVDAAYATTDDNALKIKKNVKRESYKLIKLFFDMFPNYDYSDKVVDAIFQCYVWRPLNMFWAYDRSPSGLLNLVLTWAKNRQFHRYL